MFHIQRVQNQLGIVLMETIRFKPVRQFVERYHNVVSCALNMEGLISKIVVISVKKFLTYFRVHVTNHLTDFRSTLYNG
jgi:hypothetical protein